MSIDKPDVSISLKGNNYSAAEAGLISARVDMGLNSHDRVQLDFWTESVLAEASIGDELGIDLKLEIDQGSLLDLVPVSLTGGGSANEGIWGGTVQNTRHSPRSSSLEGLSMTASLSDSRLSQTWEDMSVGDIVNDLAGEFGLSAEVEADLMLPSFSIDNTRTVWSYLYELAQLAGAELGSSADGGLRFIQANKDSGATELHYGADLIDWHLSSNTTLTPVGAAEHGAASSSGQSNWHRLSHDPVGEGAAPVRVPAAFRSRDAASTFSDAANSRSVRAGLSGEVWLGGRPELRPGSWIELKGLPGGDSGPLRVKSLTHQVDGENGFITALQIEGAGGGTGSGGLDIGGLGF